MPFDATNMTLDVTSDAYYSGCEVIVLLMNRPLYL